jgi:hypothetical protein
VKDSLLSLYEKAAERIENDPFLAEYKYFFLEDPLLYGPTRFVLGYTDDDRAEIDNHYRWLCTTSSKDLLEWAVSAARDFREILDENLYVLQNDVKYLFKHTTDESTIRRIQNVKQTIQYAKNALAQNDIKSATGFVYSAIQNMVEHSCVYHEKREINGLIEKYRPLAEKRINRIEALKKAHRETFKDQIEKWPKIQSFINEAHKKFPLMPYSELKKMAMKEFNLSYKTVSRRTEDPT